MFQSNNVNNNDKNISNNNNNNSNVSSSSIEVDIQNMKEIITWKEIPQVFKQIKIQEIMPTEVKINKENKENYKRSIGLLSGYPVTIRACHNNEITEKQINKLINVNTNILNHPNIVNTIGMTLIPVENSNNNNKEKEGKMYIIKEYMNKNTLMEWLCNVSIEVQKKYITKIAIDVARAINHLHNNGIVYRRLNSNNVLLKGFITEDGSGYLEVKIDVDLFNLVNDNISDNNSIDNFIAYEIRKEPTMKPSISEDIFSYGMLLCHLFSEGEAEPKRPNQVCHHSTLLQTMDPLWKELIFDCTQKDPTERPNNFTTILNSLTSLVQQ